MFDLEMNLHLFHSIRTLTFRRIQVKVLIIIHTRALLNVDAPLVLRAVCFRIHIAEDGSGSI